MFSAIKRLRIIMFAVTAGVAALAIITLQPYFLFLWLVLPFLPIFLKPTLTYTFEDDELKKWEELNAAWKTAAKSEKFLQVTQSEKDTSKKQSLAELTTQKIKVRKRLPWYIRTKVKPRPVVLKLDHLRLAVMPDRLIIFRRKMGAVSYDEVDFDVKKLDYMIQSGKVPKDSKLVEYQWKAQNKDGSPDKRVKNNVQYPVMQYSQMYIYSENGLNVRLICSHAQSLYDLKTVLDKTTSGEQMEIVSE